MHAKDVELRELARNMNRKTKVFEESLAALRKEMQDQLAAAKAEANTIELSLRREVAELEEDNKQLNYVRKQQRSWEIELKDKTEECQKQSQALELMDCQWHQKLANVTTTLEEEFSHKMKSIMQDIDTKAQKNVSNTLAIQTAQISRYKGSIDEYRDAKDAWDRERSSLKDEVVRLTAEASTYKDQCSEMTRQLTLATRHNKELYHACKALKTHTESL